MEFDSQHGTILKRVNFENGQRIREVEALRVSYGLEIDDATFPLDPPEEFARGRPR